MHAQVPLLLGLGEEERALAAALDSGDADLVHLVLFRMQRHLPLQQLLSALAQRPAARALFTSCCARMVPPGLHPCLSSTPVMGCLSDSTNAVGHNRLIMCSNGWGQVSTAGA